MKKILALLIALSFCVLTAGSALAEKPQTSVLDRHAVWTHWFDDQGNRISENYVKMDTDRGDTRQVSTGSMTREKMGNKPAEFDFIHETETYDYAKDHGSSA